MRCLISISLVAATSKAQNDSTMGDVSTPPEFEFSSKSTLFCSSAFMADVCDWSTQYFNWLACACFAKFQCEIACKPGYQLEPFVTCGNCVSEEKIRSLYPSWATDSDIKDAAVSGIANAEVRPADWRLCPVAKTCKQGQYWDKLACRCFALLECQCPMGMRTDPATMCGQCLTD